MFLGKIAVSPGWHDDLFLPGLSTECPFHDHLLVFEDMHVQGWTVRSAGREPSIMRMICP
jgi:hypothetical protein